jgi:tetratricopeptide (TPR) repeat protein
MIDLPDSFVKFFSRFVALAGIIMWLSPLNFKPTFAQTGAGGTKSLFQGVGARALSLGNAFVALSDDPSAVFFNPAGLDLVEKRSALFYYTNLVAGANQNYIGIVYPTLGIGSFGLGWIRIGAGDIEERDDFGTVNRVFDFGENQFLFSYGKQLRSNISVGLTIKLQTVSFSTQNLSDSGVGADLGFLYRPEWEMAILRDLSFGLNIQNIITPRARLRESTVNSSPLNFKIGLAKPILFGEERNRVTFLFDLNKSENAPAIYNLGLEYDFHNLAMLRVGVNDGLIAFGAGAAYSNFHFDYTLGKLFDGEDFSANHRFSVTIDIGKGKTERLRIAREKRERDIRISVDNQLWFERETEFNTNMDDGREKYYQQDYLGAYVDFNRAFDAAETLVEVAMRLRGENSEDMEANLRVETANASLQESQTMLELANAKSDSARKEEYRRIAMEAEQSTLEKELREFILQHREKGTAFFKSGLFARALNEWQLALDRIKQNDSNHLPNWMEEVRVQLENNIKIAEKEMQGNIQEAIRRADTLARRGDYVQALAELNNLRGTGLSELERQELENRIKSIQSQLSFQQNFEEGVRSYENKDWKRAVEAFERAVKANPKDAKARQYFEDAKARSLATVQEMPPNLRVKYLRGIELYRQGNFESALEIWQQLLKEQPYNKTILDAIDRARDRMKGK